MVNAIAHRDYRSTANVPVYIFQDRVEIVTPGGLPAGMRKEELGSRSVPRNPLLYRGDVSEISIYSGMVRLVVGHGVKGIAPVCLVANS